ncbi:hypothetical protein Tco_0991599 [Tanacetum coccineum]|uniref:Uncharacterized protein n=1 Tax=Tanacetum coccineum TaxID=301880 RepID=A0ABQ5F016_9ASTR
MIDCLSIVETEKVIHTVETDKVKLVVEIESFGMSSDEFDKETGPSNGLQPKQADLSSVHALNEFYLHEIHVVPRNGYLTERRKAKQKATKPAWDGKVCEGEAKSKSSQLREEKA